MLPTILLPAFIAGMMISFLPYSSSDQFGIYGLGPCPSVTPMEDFDITKIYGVKWYSIAHYSEDYFLSENICCMLMDFADGNPGKDLCRVLMTLNSTVSGTGEILRQPIYDRLVPDDTESAVWINTFLGGPINSIVLDTDYNDYIAWHECSQFPRDNPILHEQHNYIMSTKPVWKDPKQGLKKAFDVFQSNSIDIKPFKWATCQDHG